MSFRILLVEDDARLAGMVADYLGEAGFRPMIAATGSEAERRLKRETFDAVILDLMLPDTDGLDSVQAHPRGIRDSPADAHGARRSARSCARPRAGSG